MLKNISMRDAFFGRLYDIARKDRNIIVVGADMGAPSLDKFRSNLKNQFINVGIAEENMVTVATGLALSGKKVFIYAIMSFVTSRCYEMLKVDLSLMNIPVTVVGVGTGFSYYDSGPTHHSTEDIAIMRILPNMTVLSPSDSIMAAKFAEISCKISGPSYVRLDREILPSIYNKDDDFSRGLSVLRKGRDLCIISTGNMVHSALRISHRLAKRNINTGVIDLYRLKPINESLFLESIKNLKGIVTLEEHLISAGLGSIIAEALVDNGKDIPLKRFGIMDKYYYAYGERKDIQSKCGLDADCITKKISEWLECVNIITSQEAKVNRRVLLSMYKMLLKIRKVELRIEELYNLDEMKTPVHLCIGQEAVAVGVCANLLRRDYVFSNHRGHGHYIAKGGDLNSMIAELYCKATGCSRGRGGSMHLIDSSFGLMGSSSIVGGGIPIAVGAALASQLQKNNRVSIVFFGDAALEEGVLYESLNFAALKKLPVIFVCENNFYSVCSHITSRQVNDDMSMRPKAFGIPSYKVDGSDVVDVYSKASEAIRKARAGEGPSFLECRAYRWRAHSGVGDELRSKYRKIDEWKMWMKKDPVKDFEHKLIKDKILKETIKKDITKTIDREIALAFEFAKKSPLPNKNELMKYLYG